MSSVIFIHLGDSPVPRYYYESIDQVSCLSDCDIILVAKSRLRIERLEFGARNVRQLIPAELPKSHLRDVFERSIQANKSFRSGFWQYALERFLILEDAMTALREESAIHLEGDVLLFQPATQLIEKLRGVYANLATTLDHPDRAVPGFFFVNNRSALERLNRFIVDCLNKGIVGPMFNDMSILAQYRKVFGNLELSALPVLPPNYKGRTENLLGESCQDPSFLWKDSERLGMIFDAAALGQYLGGTDPRNNPLDDRGFINEKSLYDISSIDISLNSGLHIRSKSCGKYFPVANLHMHSKQLSRLSTISTEQLSRSAHSLTDYANPIVHPSLIPEREIITSERIQRIADISITDIPTYKFQRPDLNNPTAKVVVAFDESGNFVLGEDEENILIHSKIIFLNTHLIELFSQSILTRLTEPVVLITHASDHSINESHRRIADDKRIKAWLSQNLDLIHHKVRPLPIGIANSQFKHGNTKALHEVMQRRVLKDRLMTSIVSPNTAPTRAAKLTALKENGFDNYSATAEYESYLSLLARSLFVASPEGNGIDCHRTWESLYCGAVPIVDKRPWLRHFKSLPFLPISHWSNVSEERLQSAARSFSDVDYRPLTLSYWRDIITASREI